MYGSRFPLVSEAISAAAKISTGSSWVKESILPHERAIWSRYLRMA